jgi:hypothetical protein
MSDMVLMASFCGESSVPYLDEGMGMHVGFYLQLKVDMLTRDDRPVSGRGVLLPLVPASLSFP